MSFPEITGVEEIVLGATSAPAPNKEGDDPRHAFEAHIDLATEVEFMCPRLIIRSGVPFDPSRSWEQSELLFAQRIVEILAKAATLTPDEIVDGFRRARRPIQPAIEAAVLRSLDE